MAIEASVPSVQARARQPLLFESIDEFPSQPGDAQVVPAPL